MKLQNTKDSIELIAKIAGKETKITATLLSPQDFNSFIDSNEQINSGYTIMILDEFLKSVWVSGIRDVKIEKN